MSRSWETKVQGMNGTKRIVSPDYVDYSEKKEVKRRKVSEDSEYESYPTQTFPVPLEVNILINSKNTDQVGSSDPKPLIPFTSQSTPEKNIFSLGIYEQPRPKIENIYHNSFRNVCAVNATDKLSILTATAEAHKSIVFDANSITKSTPSMLNTVDPLTKSVTAETVSSNSMVAKSNTHLPSQCKGNVSPLPPVQSASGILQVSSSNKTKQVSYNPNVPMTKEQLTAWRRQARRVRNRQSAAASRQKIKMKIDELENQVSLWKSKYSEAMQRIASLENIARERYPSLMI